MIRSSSCPPWPPEPTSDPTEDRRSYTTSGDVTQRSGRDRQQHRRARHPSRLHPANAAGIAASDAARLGVKTGDRIRITTPTGSVVATAQVRHGVREGVIAVEHGFGHRELGARPHRIGDRMQPADPGNAAGFTLNDLGLVDPTRSSPAVFVDPIAGTAVRQAIPARIETV